MSPQRIGAITIALASLATACSGGTADAEVALEARWQCDVQRQTFDDLGALDAELEDRLATAGLSRADYATFKEDLASSPDLRAQVAEQYEAYCLS